MNRAEERIRGLALLEQKKLEKKIDDRVVEMESDNLDHYLIYGVLGMSESEGKKTDVYQNVGRFLYKYAGSFVENCVKICFEEKFGIDNAKTVRIPNPKEGARPKTYEIDCLVNDELAYEIKWRDATTDGDHINKEHSRVMAIGGLGYTPIRLMFFHPNRTQAIKIQEKLKQVYIDNNGEYYSGDDAWEYILENTEIDLRGILEQISLEKTNEVITKK